MSTVAVIDIGSNSIKILVARREPTGGLTALKTRTIDARISAGISKAEPRLTEEGMARGLAAIQALLADAAPFTPSETVLVATSAVRDALNGAEFRQRVLTATGQAIRILSGDEEADLIGRGLTCDPALTAFRDFYVFDLGGGSLECLTFRDRRIAQGLSLRLGCVRLTERFIPDPTAPMTTESRAAIDHHTRDELARSGFRFDLTSGQAVFAGGTMTTTRAIFAHRAGHGDLHTISPIIHVDQVRALLDDLAPMTLAARQRVDGLPTARADVFPTALATILAVASVGKIQVFHHSLYNLRWGLAAKALAV